MVACETLHQLVIYMIGKEASHPDSDFSNTKLYERVFPAMLKLAGDEDTVVVTLFHKLMIQIIHYLTRQAKGELRNGVITLVDAILEAMCQVTEDNVLKQTASKMLHEYLKWSNKQQTDADAKVKTVFQSS